MHAYINYQLSTTNYQMEVYVCPRHAKKETHQRGVTLSNIHCVWGYLCTYCMQHLIYRIRCMCTYTHGSQSRLVQNMVRASYNDVPMETLHSDSVPHA